MTAATPSTAAAPARTIDSPDAFLRLVADPSVTRAQLVGVDARADVWWQVLRQGPELAVWVAANRHLPADVAEHLALHPSTQVRAALATGAVPPAVMLRLAHDRSDLIRLRVVCHEHAPREVLRVLAADACPLVSAHAQARLTQEGGIAPPQAYLDTLEVIELLH